MPGLTAVCTPICTSTGAKGNAIIVLMNRTPDGDTEVAMERIFERVSSEMLGD